MRKHSFRAAIAAAFVAALTVAAAPGAQAMSSLDTGSMATGGTVAAATLAADNQSFQDIAADQFAMDIFDSTNRARAAAGVAPLRWNNDLYVIAQSWSEQMAKEDRMYHRSNQPEVYPREWQAWGENVLQNWSDASADALVQQWLDSPPHRAAMLSSGYDQVGIGYAVAPSGKLYATQNFMR